MEYRRIPHGNEHEKFGVLGLGFGGIGTTPVDEIEAINCMRCVASCPMNSRALPETFRAMITKMLNEHAAGYKEPVVFL